MDRKSAVRVNCEKSGIRRPSKGQLLGFGFWHAPGGEIRPRVSNKSYIRLKEKIRKITSRSWSIRIEDRIKKLMQVNLGWGNYFAHADAQQRLIRIKEWTPARLWMCTWKQWKRVKTRIASLRKRSVSKQKA